MDTSLKKQAEIAFKIINSSARAKQIALDAIKMAKNKKFKDANTQIIEARKVLGKGAQEHVSLVQYEAAGNNINVSLLLIHAEDQMLTTETIILLAKEFIEVYKNLKN